MNPGLPEPEIVTRKGKPVSVILPIKLWRKIVERLEDADDVACLKKARRKPLQYRPLEDVLADLTKPKTRARLRRRLRIEDLAAAMPKDYQRAEFGWNQSGREVW